MRMGGVGIGVRMGGGTGGTVVRWRPGQPCSEDRTGTRVGWCPSLGWEHGEGGDGDVVVGGGTPRPRCCRKPRPLQLRKAPPRNGRGYYANPTHLRTSGLPLVP